MNYYLLAIKGYAIFRGRSRRAEYWYFTLVHAILIIITIGLDFTFDLTSKGEEGELPGVITLVYATLTIIPLLAVSIRRLHDTGRTGWWILLGLTVIGAPVLLYWYISDSQPGDNQFGRNPKQIIV